MSEWETLPCDVQLPPATTITKGCKLSTLLHALELRGMAVAPADSCRKRGPGGSICHGKIQNGKCSRCGSQSPDATEQRPEPTSDVVARVARAVKRDPTEEPTMPGLSGHFPVMEYHGAAQYVVECDCGFKTKPGNHYVAKAKWARHAALFATPEKQYAQPCDAHEYIEAGCKECGRLA